MLSSQANQMILSIAVYYGILSTSIFVFLFVITHALSPYGFKTIPHSPRTFGDFYALFALSFLPVVNLSVMGVIIWCVFKDPDFKPFCGHVLNKIKYLFS